MQRVYEPTKLEKTVIIEEERNYGIDFLRVVSMWMVVTLHILLQGGALSGADPMSVTHFALWLVETASFCAVNCYALISGYVGYKSKHRGRSIISLSFTVIFYIFVITLVSMLIIDGSGFSDICDSLMDMKYNGYWYFTSYFCAFFFFPYYNKLGEKLDQKSFKKLVILLFVLFSVLPVFIQNDIFGTKSGYSPCWISVMYIMGMYIRKYGIDRRADNWKYLILYGTSVFFSWMCFVIGTIIPQRIEFDLFAPSILITYVSPTMVVAAYSLFMIFSCLKLRPTTIKIISFLAPLTFGVYLIHTQYFVWNYFIKERFAFIGDMNPFLAVITALAVSALLYLLCSVLDFIRKLLFKLLRADKVAVFAERIFSELIEKLL